MKRREEIEKAAHQKYPYEGGTKGLICENSILVFIQGAEWADKTMIDKACKWLKEHIYEYIAVGNTDYGKPYDIYLCNEELFDDFHKAMEE